MSDEVKGVVSSDGWVVTVEGQRIIVDNGDGLGGPSALTWEQAFEFSDDLENLANSMLKEARVIRSAAHHVKAHS
jgi:hypothetical protein